MAFVYTIFFIDRDKCKDYLRAVKFPSKSNVEIHAFYRKDCNYDLVRPFTPSDVYSDGRPIVVNHPSVTTHKNAVEENLIYFASSFDFSRYNKADVYLVSGDDRRYEELARILRKDKNVSAWAIDGQRTSVVDWLDTSLVCKVCKIIFDNASECLCHYDQLHFHWSNFGLTLEGIRGGQIDPPSVFFR